MNVSIMATATPMLPVQMSLEVSSVHARMDSMEMGLAARVRLNRNFVAFKVDIF